MVVKYLIVHVLAVSKSQQHGNKIYPGDAIKLCAAAVTSMSSTKLQKVNSLPHKHGDKNQTIGGPGPFSFLYHMGGNNVFSGLAAQIRTSKPTEGQDAMLTYTHRARTAKERQAAACQVHQAKRAQPLYVFCHSV